MTALRALNQVRVAEPRRSGSLQRLRQAAFKIGLISVIFAYAISGNSLEDMGVKYADPGGNPLEKLSPETYLAMLAASILLLGMRPAGAGIMRLFKESPALATSIALTLFCAFYSIVNVGMTGAAVYVDSYLSAAFLAIALEGGTDRQKRTLAWWIIGFVVISVFMSIGESLTQTHWIPMYVGDPSSPSAQAILHADADNFRGAGLFTHPLAAALADSMAVFLLLRMSMNGLVKAVLFGILMVGLLSFGGRAAMGTTLIMLLLTASVVLVRGVARKDLSIGFVGAIAAAALILPPLFVLLVANTHIGARLVSHLYFDGSAKARDVQWLVLNHLNLHDVTWGVSETRLNVLKYQIGLGGADTDIENFWLLMFLDLGAIGFTVFLIAFALLLGHLARVVNHPLGWIMILASILIDSTSNSLGRKSSDLFFMTACLIAMTGYAKTAPVTLRRRATNRLARSARRFGLSASPVNLAGLKP